MRLKKMIKRYSLRESPLYRLLGKERFRKIVGIPWEIAEKIIFQDNYHVFTIGNKKKNRDIQSPLDQAFELLDTGSARASVLEKNQHPNHAKPILTVHC